MRDDMDMRYRKIQTISFKTNSERNLVLRQRFALAFLQAWKTKKTIINIDESWLGMADFGRMKWRIHNTTNSVARLQIVQRISMITGLDNHGRVYLSLVQANSNNKVNRMYF